MCDLGNFSTNISKAPWTSCGVRSRGIDNDERLRESKDLIWRKKGKKC